MYTSMLTSLCIAEWSSCQSSPRQACLRHAGQIHKLQPHHSSGRRSGLHCQSVCPGNSESHVLWVGSSVCKSPGAIYPPCVWRIQPQPDALVGWECAGAGRGVDVVGWLNAGAQCEFGSYQDRERVRKVLKQCLDNISNNTIMGNFTNGLRNIAPLDTLTLLLIIKPKCLKNYFVIRSS